MTLDVESYLTIPRLSGLRACRGGRLIVEAATVPEGATEFATAIWEVDPAGGARQLTAPRFHDSVLALLPDGSVLLNSRRPDPAPAPVPEPYPAGADQQGRLWLVPAGAGEARPVSPPGDVLSARVAGEAATIVLLAGVHPGAETLAEHRERARERRTAGGTALCFDEYPVRFWDHYLGPHRPRLLVAATAGDLDDPRDLTGDVGERLHEADFAVAPDGGTVFTTWEEPAGLGERVRGLVALDVATGARREIFVDPDRSVDSVEVSPDGRHLAVVTTLLPDLARSPDVELWLVAAAAPRPGAAPERHRLAANLDRWPHAPVFAADGSELYFLADDEGHAAVYRVDLLDAGRADPVRLSADGTHSDLAPLADGSGLMALRSGLREPPAVVRLDPGVPGQAGVTVHAVEVPELPGRVGEVRTEAQDGTPLRAWLVSPPEASDTTPAPLVVFLHGGPLSSWNSWQWRWQPHLLAARGYAVLLPDPALSTGYGRHMVQRGWGQWGGTPYTDALALTDAALRRPDLDAQRTAVAGGSYGGYLTNWVVGHTDRFRCAVTHASLWSLGQFRGTTDDAVWWDRSWGEPQGNAEFYRRWSPETYADAVRTPTLVIHGGQDYRVPIGEGLRMWTDLTRRGVPARLLVFPDENHWILRPGNVRTWYGAVLGWLDHHLRDAPLDRPPLT